jgi:signal transduction histidine kinase
VAPDGQVEILVDDAGPGIPPGEREKVFEPYFTTKDGGTGLGLALVYKIVAEHGGRVEIHDSPAGGGRFRILLPPVVVEDAWQRTSA